MEAKFVWSKGELFAVKSRAGHIIWAAGPIHPRHVQRRLAAALEAAAEEELRRATPAEKIADGRWLDDRPYRPAYLGDFEP